MNLLTTTHARCLVTVIFAGLLLAMGADVAAQTTIEPGPPGTIDEAILGDTTATGERNSCHYVLRRDAVYIYNQRIDFRANCEWIVEAEDGDGARPIIRPAALPGGEEAPRPFHIFTNSTVRLKSLYLDSYDTSLPDPGRPSDNATVRIGADEARVFIDDVRFDRNRQAPLRTDNSLAKVYITNSQFSNIYNDTRPDQSFVFDTRGNRIDSLVFVNNSVWNIMDVFTNAAAVAKVNYYKFDHNTFVNVGIAGNGDSFRLDTLRAEELGEEDEGGISLAQASYGVFRNNLMVNVGVFGQETNDIFVPRVIVDVDSAIVEIDSVTSVMEPPMGIDIRNNVYSFDASIANSYPDTVRVFTEDEIYDPTLDLFIEAGGTGSTLLMMDVPLASGAEVTPDVVVDFHDYVNGVRSRETLFFPSDTRVAPDAVIDFSYPTTSAAYTAGVDGLPVGDLNWFGMADGYVSGPDEFASIVTSSEATDELPEGFALHGNYPNPFNPSTRIRFDLPFAASVSVEVFDVLGRSVLSVPVRQLNAGDNHSVAVDASSLTSGMYVYIVKAETDADVITKAGRMVLVK